MATGRRAVGTPRAEIMSTIAAAAKNESESMTNAVPVPTTAIAAPAIGGAMIPVSCIVPWRSALPEDSWSLARVRGRNACWAGTNAASAMPNRMPSSASSGIVALWVTTSAAIAPTSTPRARWAATIIVRAGRRSARTPKGRMRTARGTPIAIRTVPSARPDFVRSRTSQASATMWK